MNHFWDWTDFGSYLQCVAAFAFVGSLLMYTFSDVWFFVEMVGFIAVFVGKHGPRTRHCIGHTSSIQTQACV